MFRGRGSCNQSDVRSDVVDHVIYKSHDLAHIAHLIDHVMSHNTHDLTLLKILAIPNLSHPLSHPCTNSTQTINPLRLHHSFTPTQDSQNLVPCSNLGITNATLNIPSKVILVPVLFLFLFLFCPMFWLCIPVLPFPYSLLAVFQPILNIFHF